MADDGVVVSWFFNRSVSNDDTDDELVQICDEIEGDDARLSLLDSKYNKDLCDICLQVEKDVISVNEQSGRPVKRSIDDVTIQIPAKRVRNKDEPSSSMGPVKVEQYEDIPSASTSSIEPIAILGVNEIITCSTCRLKVEKRYFANHVKSDHRENNVTKSHTNKLSNVSVVETAFGNRIITYKISSQSEENNFGKLELFLNSIKNKIFVLINESFHKHTVLKVNFVLHADFIQSSKNLNKSFDFQTPKNIIQKGDNLDILFSSLCDTLIHKISAFEKKDGGSSLNKIIFLEMNVNKLNPSRGTFIELPQDIKSKKAVVNIKNTDNFCLKWALLSGLYPVRKNTDRVSSYSIHSDKLNFDGISFPVKLSDISKVEELNNLSINVFGLEYDKNTKSFIVVGPLHLTNSEKSVHINVLYLTEGNNGHYCCIKNLSRLVSKQVSKHLGAIYICNSCLLYFRSQERLNKHKSQDCAWDFERPRCKRIVPPRCRFDT